MTLWDMDLMTLISSIKNLNCFILVVMKVNCYSKNFNRIDIVRERIQLISSVDSSSSVFDALIYRHCYIALTIKHASKVSTNRLS